MVFKIHRLTFSCYNQMKRFSASMNIKYNETYRAYKGPIRTLNSSGPLQGGLDAD